MVFLAKREENQDCVMPSAARQAFTNSRKAYLLNVNQSGPSAAVVVFAAASPRKDTTVLRSGIIPS